MPTRYQQDMAAARNVNERAEAYAREIMRLDSVNADLLAALQYLTKVPSRLSGEQLATAQKAISKATGE